MSYQSINPTTQTCDASFPYATKIMIKNGCEQLSGAFTSWSQTPLEKRKDAISLLPNMLQANAQAFAILMAKEMGKPIAQGLAEINKCIDLCHFYIKHIDTYLSPTPLTHKAFTYYQPIGTILGVMPWNFPFWQVFRFAIPALLAGNTVLLKPAPSVPACALKIQALMNQVFSQQTPFHTLFLTHEDTKQLITNPAVKGLSFTGSSSVGALLAQRAATVYKPYVLECGGSDPFIVCQDADINKAVDAAITSRFLNSGQTCISAKRFFVQQDVHHAFVRQFKERLQQLIVGDPLQSQTVIGPLAREDLLETLERQFRESVAKGATVQVHSLKKPAKGFFFSPCLLSHVQPNMAVCLEETFGPLAVVSPFKTVEDGIAMANQSHYGLGASFWSANEPHIQYAIQKLEAGNVFINNSVRSFPDVPFGGIKYSGTGKELGKNGVTAFCYNKSVVMAD